MKKIYQLFSIAFIGLCFAFNEVQVFDTSIKINVRNELGNIEEGVSVQLFGSEEDYRKEQNPVTEVAITDKKGNVKFKDLEAKVYFVNAKKGDKNNVGAGVQTDMLEAGKLNKVTIIIE
ncbi:carboxypeptidase regulatory-like domain-containing protein [Fulvivirga lutea]|uniref:carboxypeptidase regulatory-like domain-containing protein n=1 Tax=Fulvivirga lutea TaxID=2810512 RepID=UPI001F3550C3|nr:carboxypeptidase regulatory-like domain-containing protein [Fulvivirga lutea]